MQATKVTGWITLHRPDGDFIHLNVGHIVFVMGAAGMGADPHAKSELRLGNGFCYVREPVEEVLKLIEEAGE